jgi:hypothetical protein
MTTIINVDKINNIIFFNPRTIKDNNYKYGLYDNLLFDNSQIDLEIYPNKDDTEQKKVSAFKKFRDILYKDIRSSGKFCDGLNNGFVKDSLKDCDAILRVESSMTRSKKINGFATLKFYKGSKTMYIDVICTNTDIKGTGTYIINLLNKICKDISIKNIKLSATETALPFYLKTDFECDPLCKMKKEITGGASKTRKNRKTLNSKTRRKYYINIYDI